MSCRRRVFLARRCSSAKRISAGRSEATWQVCSRRRKLKARPLRSSQRKSLRLSPLLILARVGRWEKSGWSCSAERIIHLASRSRTDGPFALVLKSAEGGSARRVVHQATEKRHEHFLEDAGIDAGANETQQFAAFVIHAQ